MGGEPEARRLWRCEGVCVHLPLSLQTGPELFQLQEDRGSLMLVLTLVTWTSVPSL